ncbi:MAG: hypothetical protein M3N53_08950 [Actinomycetota bacterium]|nr:hypothetical protein [Actinomycetota bacterium]
MTFIQEDHRRRERSTPHTGPGRQPEEGTWIPRIAQNRCQDEARQEFGEQTAAWLLNREAPYTEDVLFQQPSESDTGYRDEPVMKEPTLHQGVEKVKDVLGIGTTE